MYDRLLGRPQVQFDLPQLGEFYRDQRILVTGAAGSVGSELCLQLAELGCAHLAMLDQFDHGLLNIVEQARRCAPHLEVTEALCDIRDEGRLDSWMRRIEPDIVIHAAALKHVHLGERHPAECVLTNLIGVRNAVSAAVNNGASHFMLISSDKAAAPSCVMGATKRLAELYLKGFQLERTTRTQLKSVRFGNVIGSQGSVLPRFEAQIAQGGPIEITHQDMERFFMSGVEAVGLILNVLALDDRSASGAASYYMEMGKAVSIVDLAAKLMRKAGKVVPLKVTGLRAGEKLREQLFDQYETVMETALPNVFRVTPCAVDAYVTSADVSQLETIARTMDDPVVAQRVFSQLDQRLGREERAAG